MNKYAGLYSGLNERRTDSAAHITLANRLMETVKKSEDGKALKYLKESMEPVSDEYTHISFREANRVKDALEKDLANKGIAVEFEFQGSVTNGTNIRAKSDIDLLELRTEFYTVKFPLTVSSPYRGNPLDDLVELRSASIEILESRFFAATVGKKNPMCVPIEGGSLLRKVDVVPSNWYHTMEYQNASKKEYLGVQVLDAVKRERIVNFPFLHNYRLAQKDARTLGKTKPLIRGLKNILADNENIDISSYNINGLVYNIPDEKFLRYQTGNPEVELLERFLQYSKGLQENIVARVGQLVPNGTRELFSDFHSDGIQIKELALLNDCVEELLSEVYAEKRPTQGGPSFHRLGVR